tara:strand:- start:463 stop:771 length:309 start_codon:yes stop_codon:yes gene_type:complete
VGWWINLKTNNMIGIYVRDSLNRKKVEVKQTKRVTDKLNEIGFINGKYLVYTKYDNLISDLKNDMIKVVVIESKDRLSRDYDEFQKRRSEISKYSQLISLSN